MMTAWKSDELARIESTDELEIAARRPDGTLRRGVTIWVVRHDDGLYVRSVNGRDAAWFRGALATHEGRIRAGGVEKEVTFVEPDHDIGDALDAAYRSKYRRYAASIVGHIVSPAARSATLHLVPLTAR
jgi:hypothetical protein